MRFVFATAFAVAMVLSAFTGSASACPLKKPVTVSSGASAVGSG